MDAEGLKALFAPFAAVTVKSMFGGRGIYADGVCFAIEHAGEVYLKVDADTQPEFVAAGSKPFVYDAKGRAMTMGSLWRLSASAYDDVDELKRWASLGLGAARRAAGAKSRPKVEKPK